MSPFSIWKCRDPQALHRLVLEPTNLNPCALHPPPPCSHQVLSSQRNLVSPPNLALGLLVLDRSTHPLYHMVVSEQFSGQAIPRHLSLWTYFANDTGMTFQSEKQHNKAILLFLFLILFTSSCQPVCSLSNGILPLPRSLISLKPFQCCV